METNQILCKETGKLLKADKMFKVKNIEDNYNKSIEDMKLNANFEIDENKKIFCYDNKSGEYYEFKKTQGYSEFENSQKREALENVLIPYTEEENKKMILDAGFSHCETIFKWVNFATFIAIKKKGL